MSLANFQRNILVDVRNENFDICDKKGWSIEEKDAHINLYDENQNLIDKFFGHIMLSKFLKN